MRREHCFSRFKENTMAIYPFKLADVARYLKDEYKIGSVAFLVEDMSVNKYFSENEMSKLNSIEDFLFFCDQLKEPFVLEFELKNETLNINVDDGNYIILEFTDMNAMKKFLENLLSGLNLSNLFKQVWDTVGEHFICINNDGEIYEYKDYQELMESE